MQSWASLVKKESWFTVYGQYCFQSSPSTQAREPILLVATLLLRPHSFLLPFSFNSLQVISQQTSLACQNVCKVKQMQEEGKIELVWVKQHSQTVSIFRFHSWTLRFPLLWPNNECPVHILPVKEVFQSSPWEFLLRFKSLQWPWLLITHTYPLLWFQTSTHS